MMTPYEKFINNSFSCGNSLNAGEIPLDFCLILDK
jgi:hypothetical protein